jgi:putative Holliday junction resolvase
MLAPQPRIVAVDYGTKRVGLAVADPLRMFAQPLGTYPPDDAVERLRTLHRAEGLEALVVGWPLTPEGEEGKAVARVRPFFNRLRNAFPGVDLIAWDERFSSSRAKEAIRAAGAGRKARRDRARVDRAAAAIILQEYLDEQNDAPSAFATPNSELE